MTKKNSKKQEDSVNNETPVQDELTETAIVAAEELPGLVNVDTDFTFGAEHAEAEHKITGDELIIPMLRIVQSGSKILKNREDIREGDIYNTVTGQVWDGARGVLLVPICHGACVIERKSSKEGGEFIAKLSAELEGPNADPRVVAAYKENAARGEKNPWVDLESEQRTQLQYCVEVYVALLDPRDGVSTLYPALIPFQGKNVFPRKLWWSGMAEVKKDKNGRGSPRYAFRTLLKTKVSHNPTGNDSYVFVPEAYGGNWSRCRLAEVVPQHKETLDRCLDFHKLIQSGALGKVDYTKADDTEDAQEAAALKDEAAF